MLVPLTYNLRSLAVRRSATLLTVLGIGATVAVVAGVLALQQGFRDALHRPRPRGHRRVPAPGRHRRGRQLLPPRQGPAVDQDAARDRARRRGPPAGLDGVLPGRAPLPRRRQRARRDQRADPRRPAPDLRPARGRPARRRGAAVRAGHRRDHRRIQAGRPHPGLSPGRHPDAQHDALPGGRRVRVRRAPSRPRSGATSTACSPRSSATGPTASSRACAPRPMRRPPTPTNWATRRAWARWPSASRPTARSRPRCRPSASTWRPRPRCSRPC